MNASALKCADHLHSIFTLRPVAHRSYGDVSHATSELEPPIPRRSRFSACSIEKLGVDWCARLDLPCNCVYVWGWKLIRLLAAGAECGSWATGKRERKRNRKQEKVVKLLRISGIGQQNHKYNIMLLPMLVNNTYRESYGYEQHSMYSRHSEQCLIQKWAQKIFARIAHASYIMHY